MPECHSRATFEIRRKERGESGFLKEITPKAKITQIGFFTSDIFSAMKNWDELLGVDGWILYKHSDERIQNIVRRPGLCEEKFQFYAACAMLGNTQIELIQPLYGLPFTKTFARTRRRRAPHEVGCSGGAL